MIIIFLLNEITTIQNIDNFLSNIGYLLRSIRYFFLLFSIFVHHYVFPQQNNVNNSRHENYCIYYHSKLINHQKTTLQGFCYPSKRHIRQTYNTISRYTTPSREPLSKVHNTLEYAHACNKPFTKRPFLRERNRGL